jgi:hypothetical protein
MRREQAPPELGAKTWGSFGGISNIHSIAKAELLKSYIRNAVPPASSTTKLLILLTFLLGKTRLPFPTTTNDR